MRDFLKNNKKYLKETAIIIIVGIIINIACFLMCSFYSRAATSSGQLPFVISNNQPTYNSWWNDYVKNTITSQSVWTSHVGPNDTVLIIPRTYYSYDGHIRFYCYINPTFNQNIDINTFDYYNAKLRLSCNDFIRIDIHFDSNNTNRFDYNYFHESYSNEFLGPIVETGNSFTNMQYGFTVTEDYPVALLGANELINSVTGDSIIVNSITDIGTTEFIPADEISTTTPTTIPQLPTLTAPTIDTSLSVIENIQNLFSWFGNTVKSLFQWLIDVITTLFSNLVLNVKNFINAIIQAVNNGFNNVFNNIKSLFYPFITFFTGYAQGIQDFIDEITDSQTGIIPFLKTQIANIRTGIASLVDDVISIKNFLFGVQGFFDTYGIIWNQETWEEALDSSPWLTAVTDNTTTLSQFINGTMNVAEPQTLEFSFDFRNNRYCNFGLTSFNFDWYLPYKNSVRLAFLTICILNAVLYFFDEAPNWFSGGGSNKKGDK